MNRSVLSSFFLLTLFGSFFPVGGVAGVVLRDVEPDFRPGTSGAVLVERGALVHTALLLPVEGSDAIVAQEARGQMEAALGNLEEVLLAAGTDLDHLVRLHVYVADAGVAGTVEQVLAGRFRRGRQPAVTFVETEMPREGVLVMLDAVAAGTGPAAGGDWEAVVADGIPRMHPRGSHAAVQAEGPWVSISGRAAPGGFEQGIRDTMERLRDHLEEMELGFQDVVQVKAFLRDMPRMPEAAEIIAEVFSDGPVPPLVFTEWRQDSIPAEIELVAVAQDPGEEGGRLAFIEAMSRFSRVVRVNEGRPVFISGLYGKSDDPREQVREIFGELQRLLEASGSDLRHLVKATYYVSDREADREINEIRPTLYDPERAPAASKLAVRGTGREGKGSTLDMIAIRAEN